MYFYFSPTNLPFKLSAYINKIFKIVIKLKKLFQNIQRNFNQTWKGTDLVDFESLCILFINCYISHLLFKLNLFKSCLK